MARKGLPKWAIKQAGGNFKKAWRLVKRGRGKKKASSGGRRSNPSNPRRRGMLGKLNGILKGLKIGLPAFGALSEKGFTIDAGKEAISRYTGYDVEANAFNGDLAIKSATIHGTLFGVDKALNFLRLPQMAGRRKILAVVGQYWPEIQAIPALMQGETRSAMNNYGQASHGYWPVQHQTWLQEGGRIRDAFISSLGARVALGLASRFLGPMINKHLPKGVNI